MLQFPVIHHSGKEPASFGALHQFSWRILSIHLNLKCSAWTGALTKREQAGVNKKRRALGARG
jgi:hypothetical protein